MKTFLPLQVILLFSISLPNLIAQSCSNTAIQFLRANQVKATFSNAGDLFSDGNFDGGFAVPYVPGQPEVHTILAASLIVAGLDNTGDLRVSGVGYRYSDNQTDYIAGPLDDETGEPLPDGCANFDRIWQVRRYEVLQVLQDFADNGQIDQPIPQGIRTWPGRGNPLFAEAMGFELPDQDLAPFFDRNDNGLYEPNQGDYPLATEDMTDVIPDQFIWTVFNDVGNNHPFIPSEPLGVEVHLMAYGFNCSDNLDLSRTVFTRHKVMLKGDSDMTDFIAGYWFDADLGCHTDDYLGTDSTLNTVYYYNGDAVDGEDGCICPQGVNTYCETPPVQAITVLNKPLYRSMAFLAGWIDGPPATSNPETAPDYYHYLRGFWRSGEPLTVGGYGYNPGIMTPVANHVFFDDPTDPDGWSMNTENLGPVDIRTIFSTPPENLSTGASTVVDMAFSFHQESDASHLQQVGVMQQALPLLQEAFDSNFEQVCSQVAFCETDCVWPGDADHSGRVDKDDILTVGVGAGHTGSGAARNPVAYDWAPFAVEDWTEIFIDETNYKHGDCNGDGTITPVDEAVVELNYGESVDGFVAPEDVPVPYSEVGICMDNSRSEITANGPSPILQMVRTDINLGTEEHPVEDLYGISFTLRYDTSLMQWTPSFPVITITSADLFGEYPQRISIGVAHPERGRIDFSVCRTDGQEINGYGKLAEVWLQLRADAVTGNPDGTREVVYEIVNLKAIDFEENFLDIGYKSDTTLAVDLPYDPEISAIDNRDLSQQLRLSPNPNSGKLQVHMLDAEMAEEVRLSLFTIQGQPVFEQQLALPKEGALIELPSYLNTGAYFVRLINKEGQQLLQKLIIQR